MRFFVTGGAGFIGSHFSKMLLGRGAQDSVVVYDKLTYAGNMENLRELAGNPRYSFVRGDICDAEAVGKSASGCDWIVNFAAETHVDRSIVDAGEFVRTDILGTQTLLEFCRRHDTPFLHISTDEVYGSTEKGSFSEYSPLNPSSPYSASKAGGDLLVLAYFRTYGLKAMLTRSTNNYGPNQHPEKLIPNFITRLLRGKKVPLYGDGRNVRDWVFVLDNCNGIDTVLRKGKSGEIYNIGGGSEKTNLEITVALLKALGKDGSSIEHVKDRPGHDFRYSLDSRKAVSLGWKTSVSFEEGLERTVAWYRANEWWWKPLLSH
jgi:dTDP-glucose 4,6-dehydratase